MSLHVFSIQIFIQSNISLCALYLLHPPPPLNVLIRSDGYQVCLASQAGHDIA